MDGGAQVSKTTATSTEVIMKTEPRMKLRKKKMASTPPAESILRVRSVGAITCEGLGVGGRAGWGEGQGVRSRAATGVWPMRGWAADPRVVVGRPEREEGEEGVGEAVEAIAKVALESAPEISGVGGGVGGVEACAEGCAARAW